MGSDSPFDIRSRRIVVREKNERGMIQRMDGRVLTSLGGERDKLDHRKNRIVFNHVA